MELSRISDWRTCHGSGETKEKRSSESIPHKADPDRCGGPQQDRKAILPWTFQNNKDYRVRFTSSTETDPVGIVASAVQYIQSEELDLKNGNLAFCAVDTDTDISKQGQINQARKLAEKNGVELLLSNPCFEIWFLQHFRYSTKSYASNDEVIRDLTTYIPGYKKNANVYDLIAHAQEHAVKRAKQLEQHHAELGRKKNSMECNPSTDAYKVLEITWSKREN